MNRRGREAVLVLTTLSTFACSDGTKYIGSHSETGTEAVTCGAPVPPPASLVLDPFYEKYTNARGIPIVSSAGVADEALSRACDITIHVLEKRDDVHTQLVENDLRVVVIDEDEVMTDIPEYFDIYEALPSLDWDNQARSVGPFAGHPLASAAEENFLCQTNDLFAGEVMLIHSLGHALRRLGILYVDPEWDARLESAYDAALAAGLWANTHAGTNHQQYFAEGVQGWYDANQDPDAVHNEINTRSELESYDPDLTALIAEYVPDDSWRPPCARP